MKLTAVFIEAPEGGYVAFAEELPGANTQGETIDEARENLKDAIELMLHFNRSAAEKEVAGQRVIREAIEVSTT